MDTHQRHCWPWLPLQWPGILMPIRDGFEYGQPEQEGGGGGGVEEPPFPVTLISSSAEPATLALR